MSSPLPRRGVTLLIGCPTKLSSRSFWSTLVSPNYHVRGLIVVDGRIADDHQATIRAPGKANGVRAELGEHGAAGEGLLRIAHVVILTVLVHPHVPILLGSGTEGMPKDVAVNRIDGRVSSQCCVVADGHRIVVVEEYLTLVGDWDIRKVWECSTHESRLWKGQRMWRGAFPR